MEFFKALDKCLNMKSIVGNNTSLRDALLYDTLSRAAPDNEGASYQLILNNLNHFIEYVHHASYSLELLQCKLEDGVLDCLLINIFSCGLKPY